jgi:hypothetical protein
MQQQTSNFVINAGLLGALGALWGRTPTSVSPFLFGTPALGTAEKKALVGAGFCNEQGQVVPQAQGVLDILGTATSFTRIYLSGGPNAYEYIVYFSPGGAGASLVNVHGDMQIDTPPLASMITGMAAETIGSSLYHSSPFEATLSPGEAVVLAGMIDLQRKAVLRSLAGDTGAGGVAMDIASIQASFAGNKEDNQWLANVVSGLVGTDGIQGDNAGNILDSLVAKGLVRSSSSSYILSDGAQFLARRMLVFDTALTLTAGHLGNEGTVTVAGFTCLQAGVHDLLVLDASGGNISMRSISSAAILDLVRTFITSASELEKLEAPPAAPARKYCPQCGAAVAPGRKFCGGCGAKL